MMHFQKTYLSRAMTRAMAVDHPIGDPTGGPAYGERNDPVSAVVAIAGMAMSAGTAATLMTGFSLAGLAAGVTFVGSALSLVGNVTGNRDLMQFGSTAAIIGGVGSLASGFFSSADIAKGATEAGAGAGVSEGAAATAGAGEAAAAGGPSVSAEFLDDAANTQAILNGAPPTSTTAAAIPAGGGDVGANMDALYGGSGMDGSPYVATSADKAGLLSDSMYTGVGTEAGSVAGQTAGNVAGNTAGGYTSAIPGADNGLAPNGWKYFSDPATNQGVAISPEGTYYSNGMGDAGMRQITSAGGQPMTAWDTTKQMAGDAVDKLKDKLPDTSSMTTMDKFLAMKIGGDIVGGITSYVAPSKQQQAQTEAANAQSALAKAQAEKLKADEELRQKRIAQLNRNMAMGVNMGTVNQGAVTVNQPGLINAARAA